MKTIEVLITDLTFPEKLEDKYSKFRPLVSVKYRDLGGQVCFAREAVPGLSKGDYWECEKANKNKPNWVRDNMNHRVDMPKIDESARTVTFSNVPLKALEGVIVEIYDIDVTGFWDNVRKKIVAMLPVLAVPYLPATLPLSLQLIKSAYEQGTGTKVNDLAKGLIDKAMGKEDNSARSIWIRSEALSGTRSKKVTLMGPGVQGDYSVSLQLTVS